MHVEMSVNSQRPRPRFGRTMAALVPAAILVCMPLQSAFASDAGCRKEANRADRAVRDQNRDSAYRDALKAVAAMQAVHRQQPSNPSALRPKYLALRTSIARLCVPAASPEPPADRMPSTPAARAETAKRARTGAAEGPVEPSTAPSSPQDIEARRRATEDTFRSAGPLEELARPAPQLAPVSEKRLSSACAGLTRRSDALDRALARRARARRIARMLARLEEELAALGAKT